MISIHGLYWMAFIIMLFCFPATVSVEVRRFYGRIFNTPIYTNIYGNIFYFSAIIALVLYVIIRIMGA